MERFSRDNYYQRLSYGLLLLAAASVSFSRFLMLPIAILMMVLYAVDFRYKLHFQTVKENKLFFPFCITLSLFLLSLIGAAYSDNVPKAISDWECKLWFAAAPLCILPLCGRISPKQIRTLLTVFGLSATATAIGNIVISTAKFAQSGDAVQFFYMNATHFFGQKPTHPSYLSLYYTIAWLISIILLIDKTIEQPRLFRIAFFASIIILPVEIILLQSKAGLLLFAVSFVGIVIHAVRRHIIPKWAAATVLVGGFVLGFVGVSGKTATSNRLGDLRQHLNSTEMANPYNGTLQRVAVWQTSCEVAADNLPFGTGTGDITDELCQRYESKGYTYILGKRLNCHNQYLQHLVGLGIPGIIVLLLFIGIPLWEGIREKDFLLWMWGVLIAGNFLVESMLETRAGSNFIPLMTMLLLLHHKTYAVKGNAATE